MVSGRNSVVTKALEGKALFRIRDYCDGLLKVSL